MSISKCLAMQPASSNRALCLTDGKTCSISVRFLQSCQVCPLCSFDRAGRTALGFESVHPTCLHDLALPAVSGWSEAVGRTVSHCVGAILDELSKTIRIIRFL